MGSKEEQKTGKREEGTAQHRRKSSRSTHDEECVLLVLIDIGSEFLHTALQVFHCILCFLQPCNKLRTIARPPRCFRSFPRWQHCHRHWMHAHTRSVNCAVCARVVCMLYAVCHGQYVIITRCAMTISHTGSDEPPGNSLGTRYGRTVRLERMGRSHTTEQW